jgi:hypothetical protein
VLLVLRDVLLIRPNAGRDRVGPADPLKLGGDVAVIQAGIVATVAADDLKRVGVAAFWLAGNDADWLAPQNAPGLIKGPHACSLRSTSLDTSRRCNARRPLARVKGPGQPSGWSRLVAWARRHCAPARPANAAGGRTRTFGPAMGRVAVGR